MSVRSVSAIKQRKVYPYAYWEDKINIRFVMHRFGFSYSDARDWLWVTACRFEKAAHSKRVRDYYADLPDKVLGSSS